MAKGEDWNHALGFSGASARISLLVYFIFRPLFFFFVSIDVLSIGRSVAGDDENNKMSSANIAIFIYCFEATGIPLNSLCCNKYRARGSNAILNRSRERGHACLVPLCSIKGSRINPGLRGFILGP